MVRIPPIFCAIFSRLGEISAFSDATSRQDSGINTAHGTGEYFSTGVLSFLPCGDRAAPPHGVSASVCTSSLYVTRLPFKLARWRSSGECCLHTRTTSDNRFLQPNIVKDLPVGLRLSLGVAVKASRLEVAPQGKAHGRCFVAQLQLKTAKVRLDFFAHVLQISHIPDGGDPIIGRVLMSPCECQ